MPTPTDDRLHRGDSELLDIEADELGTDAAVIPGVGPSNSEIAAQARRARAARPERTEADERVEDTPGRERREFSMAPPPPPPRGKSLRPAGDPVPGGSPDETPPADDEDGDDDPSGDPWATLLAADTPAADPPGPIAHPPGPLWLKPRDN